MEIGSKVIAWNPGTDRKATGILLAIDSMGFYKVEWVRISPVSGPIAHVGTFKHCEVAA